MQHNRLTSYTPLFLILLIGLVSVICINTFQEYPKYLHFFVFWFVLSIAFSASITPFQLKKKSGNNNKFGSRKEDFEPKIPFPEEEKFHLSIDQYLEINGFKLTVEIIDAIEWKRFELLCHLIFKESGFNSKLTGNGADEGVDIRIFDRNDEKKTLYLIQCKKWGQNTKVDRKLLQQLRGQMAAEKVEKGGYCITSSYTMPAREFAAENSIELFDAGKIRNSFNKLSDMSRRSILKELLKDDYWTPSCASCGEKFQKTNLKNGKTVWGCKNSSKHGWSSIPYKEVSPIKNVR
jgi:hypothetical protein